MGEKIKVAIYAGHGKGLDGAWDPGCVYLSYQEAKLMLPITTAAVKHLKASGVTVLTDENNEFNAKAQVAEANRLKADYFISLHCDYKKAPTGTMPLYVSEKGKDFANSINDTVMKGMGIKSRGLTKRDDLYELNATNMPAVIFETGSIKADLKTLKDSEEYGKFIAKGICNHIGVEFKEDCFRVKTKGKLIIRQTQYLSSKKVGNCEKGVIYTITKTNKKGTRGKLKSGAGWITITDKYCERV